MKPPFRLGPADYILIALTCGLVLVAVEYWKPVVEDWFRAVTAPAPETRR